MDLSLGWIWGRIQGNQGLRKNLAVGRKGTRSREVSRGMDLAGPGDQGDSQEPGAQERTGTKRGSRGQGVNQGWTQGKQGLSS